jgi:hypothetical protein
MGGATYRWSKPPPHCGLGQERQIKQLTYCGRPSTTNERNFAYLSPILRASLNSGELRQA